MAILGRDGTAAPRSATRERRGDLLDAESPDTEVVLAYDGEQVDEPVEEVGYGRLAQQTLEVGRLRV